MKVYIDCGAYLGDTIDCEFHFDFYPKTKIAFEANPKLIPHLEKSGFDEVYERVVWTQTCEVDFMQDQSTEPVGSSIKQSKTTGILNPIKAKAIDFSTYLKRFTNDEVLIKMDIEGAEFDVLHKMITDGTITIPKKLYVEFHPNKIPEYTTTDKLELIDEIKALGVDIEEWH